MTNNEKAIIEKLDFFLKNKIKIHITKTNREFLNGKLLSKETTDVYIIEDDEKGRMFLFVSEIFDVEEFKEVKK